MEVKVLDRENYEKEIQIKVPYEKLAPHFDAAYKKYKKSVQIEGFRKGKVPIQILKKIYGKAIEGEVIEDILPDILQQAVDQEKIKFLDLVKVSDVQFSEQKGLELTAIVKVEPEIELRKYKGFDFVKEVYQVSDEDVEEALKSLQERSATMVDVEDEAKEGHFLVADIQKTDESGHPLIGQKLENQYLLLDTKNDSNQELAEQLLGVKAGETRQIRLIAEDSIELEPKNEYYSVNVKEVKEKRLPELDDELAKDFGEDNLEALKNRVRENIQASAAEEDYEKFKNIVIDKVVKENPIEIPEFMIEHYLNRLAESFKKNSKQEFDEEKFRNEWRSETIRNIKWMLIRDKIIELENLTIEDDDIEKYIKEQSERAGKNAARVKMELRNPQKRAQLENDLLEKKVIELIIANSNVTEKVLTREDLIKQAELAENLSIE